jgi:hypothetical protein
MSDAATPPLLETLAIASRVFDTAGLRHVFIGGIAVSAWARPRTTLDIDALVISLGADAEPVAQVLRSAGFEISAAGIKREVMLAGFRAIRHIATGSSPVSLDVLVSDNPVAVEIAGRGKQRTLASTTFLVPSAEDLIVLKLQAGRSQDVADAKAVFEAQGSALDRELLQAQARLFGLDEALAELLRR